MKITTVINGKIQLCLTPENGMEEEIVKQLNGGKVQLIAQNINILNNNVAGSLLISSENGNDDKKNSKNDETTKKGLQ